MRKQKTHHMTEQMASQMKLPKDLVLGDAIVSITGRRELTIENYGGILEYQAHVIRLSLKQGQILIYGNQLNIDYYTNEDMKISGRIDKIEYSL